MASGGQSYTRQSACGEHCGRLGGGGDNASSRADYGRHHGAHIGGGVFRPSHGVAR